MTRDNLLYLARHGETVWNACGRLQGRLNSALTRRGDGQARALAAMAHRLEVERVLASSLDRARITARKVAETGSCPLEIFDALCEIDFGLCSGLSMAEVSRSYPDLMGARQGDKWNCRWPDGESYADATDRLKVWLETEAVLPPSCHTMIVAHQSINRTLISLLTEHSFSEILDCEQPADVVIRIGPDKTAFHCRVPAIDGRDPIRWHLGLPAPRSLSVAHL